MRYVNAITTVALCALALLQLLRLDDPATAFIFAFGAVAAAFAVSRRLPTKVVRLLAFLSAGVMFCYFWQFFSLTPTLPADWYRHSGTLHVIGLLFAGFGMIPVVSEYTCRMKANGNCERAGRKVASGALSPASLRS